MITLDSVTHTYRNESWEVVPGVTGILKDAGLIDTAWFNDYSRERGSYVHQACALYDRNDLDESSLDPAIAPYVQAWIKFRAETGFVPVDVEQVVFNPIYRYAGTLDVYGRMKGEQWIIDRKSGVSQPWCELQTAAYAGCYITVTEKIKRGAIELDSEGKYRLVEHKDRNDIKVFLSALAIVNWKHNQGVK